VTDQQATIRLPAVGDVGPAARGRGERDGVMTGEPTLDDLRREFPRWVFFTGVNHLPYGRLPNTSPPSR